MVARQKTFDDRKVAAFRKFCTDFFDEASTPKDPLELARHGADKLKGKRDELKATAAGSKYPFVAQLSTPIDLLDQVTGKPDDWYLTDFDLGDDLLDAKESLIDPIQAFLKGPQRVIYDDAAAFLTTHSSNLSYLPVGSDEAVRSALVDPNAFRGNRMAQLKQATDKLRAQIDDAGHDEPDHIVNAITGEETELRCESLLREGDDCRPGERASGRSIRRSRALTLTGDRFGPRDRGELRGDHLSSAAR